MACASCRRYQLCTAWGQFQTFRIIRSRTGWRWVSCRCLLARRWLSVDPSLYCMTRLATRRSACYPFWTPSGDFPLGASMPFMRNQYVQRIDILPCLKAVVHLENSVGPALLSHFGRPGHAQLVRCGRQQWAIAAGRFVEAAGLDGIFRHRGMEEGRSETPGFGYVQPAVFTLSRIIAPKAPRLHHLGYGLASMGIRSQVGQSRSPHAGIIASKDGCCAVFGAIAILARTARSTFLGM